MRGFGSCPNVTLIINMFFFASALARALEDYEKRKAAGEIPEAEEEDIYAHAMETAVCILQFSKIWWRFCV